MVPDSIIICQREIQKYELTRSPSHPNEDGARKEQHDVSQRRVGVRAYPRVSDHAQLRRRE